MNGRRIVWLDCLRAVAVSLVLWGHIFLVGMNDPTTVSVWLPSVRDFIFGPGSASRNPHSAVSVFMWTYTGTGPGGLGVALFFLISGFVILRTIDRTSPAMFLARRFFRIVPVCAVVTLATAIGTNMAYTEAGLTSPNTIVSVIAASLALSRLLQQFETIPVLWTLSAEVMFYLVIAGTAWIVGGRIGLRVLAGLSLACLTGVLLVRSPVFAETLSADLASRAIYLSRLLVYVSFMLIGAVAYRGYAEQRLVPALRWGSMCCLTSALTYFEFTALNRVHIGIWPAEAAFALLVFFAAFALDLRGSWTRPLRWVADLSYPLYLVHTPLGWAILVWLAARGWSMMPAGLLSTFAVVFVAWIVHVAIEKPGYSIGRALGFHKLGLPAAQLP